MKSMKSIFSLLIVMILAAGAHAQFTSDSKLVSAGVTAGVYGKYYKELLTYERSATMPVYLQLEKGLGEGSPFAEFSKYLTTGVFFGFSSQRLTADRYTVDMVPYEKWVNYTFLNGGILLSVHYTELLEEIDISLDPQVFDLYISAKAGVNTMLSKANYDNTLDETEVASNLYEFKDSQTYFYLAPILGARYYFTDKLAALVELGYFNTGALSAGLTYKL